MYWDVAHHRGAGFPLYLLRPFGVYTILASLYEAPHLRPTDLRNRLAENNAAAALLIGVRDLPSGISGKLGRLRRQRLIVRCVDGVRGVHTRYDLTRLGAGLVEAVDPLTQWAMSDFEFVVASTRARLDLPPLDGAVPDALRQEHLATRVAIGLLSGLWANVLMVHVDSAGEAGVSPLQLEEEVNGRLRTTSGEARLVRRLPHGTMHTTLNALVARGLLEQRKDPPRVRYVVSPHGRGLMDAWWRIAEDWGIGHDGELFPIVRDTSGWFERSAKS